MRVAMYYKNSDVRVEEQPVPKIGSDELLVKVVSSGICGSDVMEWYRVKSAPRVLGHEIAGEVVSVGEKVTSFKPGDRVFVSHHVPCNSCRYCLNGHHTLCDTLRTTNFHPGGFSEFLRVPAINVDRGVFKLPNKISFDEGTFIEPLGCVIRGLRVAGFKHGQSVLILGSGISGLLHINLLKYIGAGRIIAADINDKRLEVAKKFGADSVINAKKDLPSTLLSEEGRLPDLVIICTGAPVAITQSLKCVDRGGNILMFGVPEPGVEVSVPVFDLWKNGISIVNTYGAAPIDIQEAIDLIGTGRLDLKEMITHKLPLAETVKGFELVSKADNSIKVIIEPHA